MIVWHVVPEFVLANEHQGAFKDVLSRTRWLEARVESYRRFAVAGDDPACATGWPAEPAPTHILVEYTRLPRLSARLRELHPRAKLLVRAHNIEPLQHLDNMGWRPSRGTLWLMYGMWRLFRQDLACMRHADVLLSINEWENGVYWKWLPGRARVEWLPYVCPDSLVPGRPEPYDQRTTIACLPTSQKNRKSWDLVVRFCALARQMKRLGCTDEFVVTGRLGDWGLPPCPEVVFAGFVPDLPALLGKCRAVALLSPLGYGFKTTLADAWAAGAHVLAHPDLIRRLPAQVARELIGVDTGRPATGAAAADKLRIPSRGPELHSDLRACFDGTMRAWFNP